MNSIKRPLAVFSVAVATVFALTACTNASAEGSVAEAKSTDAGIQEKGVNEAARALPPAEIRTKAS